MARDEENASRIPERTGAAFARCGKRAAGRDGEGARKFCALRIAES